MPLFINLKEDIKRYTLTQKVGFRKLIRLLFNRSLLSIAIYRFGHWSYFGKRTLILRWPSRIAYFILYKIIVEFFFGLYFPAQCSIGKGLLIGGFCGLVINPETRIGENCTISHGVVIGTAADSTSNAPIIGNNVFIGTGANVLGAIKIGNNVKIGANAVVVKDVPDNVTVVGVPSYILTKSG